MESWKNGTSFQELLKSDKDVAQHLSDDAIDALFDMGYHVKHVDTILDRVFAQDSAG